MSTEPDLDTILFDLYVEHDPEPPSPAEVEGWCARFPAHADAIRRKVAWWVWNDRARGRVPLHYRWAVLHGSAKEPTGRGSGGG